MTNSRALLPGCSSSWSSGTGALTGVVGMLKVTKSASDNSSDLSFASEDLKINCSTFWFEFGFVKVRHIIKLNVQLLI